MAVTVSDLLNIPFSRTVIRWATYTALKKFPHTGQGVRNRTPHQILDDLFRGDLAKSALIEYLQSNGVTISQEYDRIRTDNFTTYNPQGYHFIANKSKIECNSSLFPKGKNRTTAIDCDIKVTAGDGPNIWTQPLSHKFDITVQMYFDTNTNGLITQFNRQQLIALAQGVHSEQDPALDAVIDSLNVQSRYANSIIGYGWATKQNIDQFKLNNTRAGLQTTWSYPGNSRTFWNCNIRDTNPFSTLHTNV